MRIQNVGWVWVGGGMLVGCELDQTIQRIPSAPVVLLTGPSEPVSQAGGVASFVGTVSDRHDAPPEITLSWELDDVSYGEPFVSQDGTLAMDLSGEGLSVGWHTLQVNAVDRDGDTAWALADFEVRGPWGPPTVLITAPGEGASFPLGETIAFQGEATDAATDADLLSFSWESSLEGELGAGISDAGQSVLLTPALRAGTHLITLSVEDGDGEVGQDTVTVLITEEPPDEPIEEEPVDAEPGDLVLSEFMVNPSVVDDVYGEWFELYNTTAEPIEIRGYTLRDEDYDEWVITESMVVPAKGYFLVCAETDPLLNGGVEDCDAWFYRPQLPPPGMAFGNQGDELILERPDGAEIDRLEYDAAWVVTAKATGVDPDALNSIDNDDLDNWCAQTSVITSGGEPGTPGQRNDPCF